MSTDTKYFAADEPKVTARKILTKANDWYQRLYNNNYFNTLERSWLAYHGMYNNDSHTITFGGEQGENAQISLNHYRNISQHILTMITSTKPSFIAKSANGDSKSTIQAKLATSLLEYYLRDKSLERILKKAVEYALVLGSGYIKMEWNTSVGNVYEYDEDTGEEVREGDVQFKNLSPYDVLFDVSREAENQDWVVCRTFKNKFDIITKYPDMADRIQGLKTKDQFYTLRTVRNSFDESDDIPVYEFYHKKTETLPNGRYLLFLEDEIVLIDQDMPYPDLPIFRIAGADILGTSYGYSPMFPLLEIQDALNSTHSAILTNQNAFAVQSIFVKRGSDINPKSLEGGMNIIEGNEAPVPINFTQTPGEVFNYAKMLEQQMETISGVNSVARGNPEASLKSGTALALVQASSLQYMSGLQQQYIRLMEDVATGLINMLKVFAKVPRIVALGGITNRSNMMKEFSGDDVSDINRITIEVGNPMANTHAGRVQMASDLLQYQLIKSPEQYISVMTTGRLDVMTDTIERNNDLVRAENERMLLGLDTPVLATDNHVQHIQEHQAMLADLNVRTDEQMNGIILNHINEHIRLMRETDPGLLQVLGIPALPPLPPPPQPQQPEQQQDMGQRLPHSKAPDAEGGPMGEVPPAAQVANVPQPAKVDGNLLSNPDLQQNSMGNVK